MIGWTQHISFAIFLRPESGHTTSFESSIELKKEKVDTKNSRKTCKREGKKLKRCDLDQIEISKN